MRWTWVERRLAEVIRPGLHALVVVLAVGGGSPLVFQTAQIPMTSNSFAIQPPTAQVVLAAGAGVLLLVRAKAPNAYFDEGLSEQVRTAAGVQRENVMLPLEFAGVEPGLAEQRARMLLEAVGLAHRANHRPSRLSGGEQQRVAIARALANDSPIILADEPTGNLDTATGEEIVRLLRAFVEDQGKTVIIVTHDAAIVAEADLKVYIKMERSLNRNSRLCTCSTCKLPLEDEWYVRKLWCGEADPV